MARRDNALAAIKARCRREPLVGRNGFQIAGNGKSLQLARDVVANQVRQVHRFPDRQVRIHLPAARHPAEVRPGRVLPAQALRLFPIPLVRRAARLIPRLDRPHYHLWYRSMTLHHR